MMKATKQLLEKEIKLLTEARDGIEKAMYILKRDEGIEEDEYFITLYNKWNSEIKSYKMSVEILQREYERSCVKAS